MEGSRDLQVTRKPRKLSQETVTVTPSSVSLMLSTVFLPFKATVKQATESGQIVPISSGREARSSQAVIT